MGAIFGNFYSTESGIDEAKPGKRNVLIENDKDWSCPRGTTYTVSSFTAICDGYIITLISMSLPLHNSIIIGRTPNLFAVSFCKVHLSILKSIAMTQFWVTGTGNWLSFLHIPCCFVLVRNVNVNGDSLYRRIPCLPTATWFDLV